MKRKTRYQLMKDYEWIFNDYYTALKLLGRRNVEFDQVCESLQEWKDRAIAAEKSLVCHGIIPIPSEENDA